MDITTWRELATLVGLTGWWALSVAMAATLLINLAIYFIQKQIDVGRDRKIAELQAQIDSTQKKLQSQLDFKNHISRVQFDFEFEIYKNLWQKLVAVKHELGVLELLLEDATPNEIQTQLIEGQKVTIRQRYNDFNKYLHDNMAFMVIDVINKSFAAKDVIYSITVDDPRQGQPPKEIWRIDEASMERIEGVVYEAGGAIRERLAKVNVVN